MLAPPGTRWALKWIGVLFTSAVLVEMVTQAGAVDFAAELLTNAFRWLGGFLWDVVTGWLGW